MAELMPLLAIDDSILMEKTPLSPASLFGQEFPSYMLEIGFGDGQHLAALMRRYPDVGFFGAEPFLNGVAGLLHNISCHPCESRDRGADKQPDPVLQRDDSMNVRVLMDDALLLVQALTDSCLDKIYVLNPDPWPKKRHHKRRIISQDNLDEFARVLKPGGQLIMATDVDDLAEWMCTQCMLHPAFEWTAETAKDWKTPPAEWIETRYAFKGRSAGRNQSFLVFIKN